MRGNEGFGILTVLVAAVVLTIVGVNFARKISNKAMVSKAADIIAYRDMLLEYYTSLAANRAAYKCTRTNNSAPTTSFTDIDLYDIGSGTNCTTAHKVIPIAGRDMKPWDDVAATTTIACANNNGQYICMQAQWKTNGTVVEIKISTVFDHEDFAHSDVSAVLRDRAHSVFFGNTTVGTSCGNVTGFTGNKPLVALKSYPSNLISCGSDTLVVPPNYPYPPSLCPDTSLGGKRGITGFDPITGVSRCSNKILAYVKLNASGDCSDLRGIPKLEDDSIGEAWTGYNARFGIIGVKPTGAIPCSGSCQVNNKNSDGSLQLNSCGFNIDHDCADFLASSGTHECTFRDPHGKVTSIGWCKGDDLYCCQQHDSSCSAQSATYDPNINQPWLEVCEPCNKDAQRAAIEPSSVSNGGIYGWNGANSEIPGHSIIQGEIGLKGRSVCQLIYQYYEYIYRGTCERNHSCSNDSHCNSGERCSSSSHKCRKNSCHTSSLSDNTSSDCDDQHYSYTCEDVIEIAIATHCPGSPTGCFQWSQ